MGVGRVIGGIFALIGGFFIALAVFYSYFYQISSGIDFQIVRWIIHLIICLLAIVGGVLALASKKGGGILTFIAGFLEFLMPLIVSLVATFPINYWFSPYPGLYELTGWGTFSLVGQGFTWFFTFEGFLIFLGSLLIINSHGEKY